MSYLRSMPDKAVLLNVFKAYPKTALPLLQYHEMLLRGPSPFSIGERELIAAYVSALNTCNYCVGVHKAVSAVFGIDESILTELIENGESSVIDKKLKPILFYVKKLTLSPSKITPDDAEMIFNAGWDDRALYDAVSVCALFNFMNRLVEGLGITADSDYFRLAANRLSSNGYAGLSKMVEQENS